MNNDFDLTLTDGMDSAFVAKEDEARRIKDGVGNEPISISADVRGCARIDYPFSWHLLSKFQIRVECSQT